MNLTGWMKMKFKQFEVYYEGTSTIEANDDSEATGEVYDKLQEACVGEFRITGSEEVK